MTQFATFALQMVIKQIDEQTETRKEASQHLSPEANRIADYVLFATVKERLIVLIDLLEEVKDPTATKNALKQFHAECVNRLFIMQCTEQLHCQDLIQDLRKFAVNHLPLLEPQTTH